MKGREGKAAPPTDLLVCFPSIAHLSLTPKQICSPVRATDATKRHNHHLQLARASNKGVGGQGSPLVWAKTKANMGSSEIEEPTSPKVTCVGQIKVRPKSGGSCKNWQSVMEEIERIHNNRSSSSKHIKKKATWVEALGFKKDAMQFLTCLRGFRLNLRCFGHFHGSGVISDDDEDEDEEDESEVGVEGTTDHDDSSSKTVFSKWFMVLQEENQRNNELNKEKSGCEEEDEGEEEKDYFPSAPPPNALLLMRCRSAPAKSWLEEKEEEERQQQNEKEEVEEEEESKKLKLLLEEEKKNESLILKCYSPDFFKVSSDVAKETWVVGGMRDPRDPLSRSRSWKR